MEFSPEGLDHLYRAMKKYVDERDRPGIVAAVSKDGASQVVAVGSQGFGDGSPATRSPALIPRSANQPLRISIAYIAGPRDRCVVSSCGAMSSMLSMRPSAATNAIDSGMNVFFIQNALGSDRSKTNTIP